MAWISNDFGRSVLLFDDLDPSNHKNIGAKMNDDWLLEHVKPTHYAYLLWTCDIGISKYLEQKFKKYASLGHWNGKASFECGNKLPASAGWNSYLMNIQWELFGGSRIRLWYRDIRQAARF